MQNPKEYDDFDELDDEEYDSNKSWAPCPYSSEIRGDETLCYCSDEQRRKCAMDI